jgi:hypothetical protein
LNVGNAKTVILLSVSSTDDPSTVTERWAALTWAKWLKRIFKIDIVIYDACGGVV